jgi:uncharacterized protein HemX
MADDTSNDTPTSETEDEKKGSGPLMGVLAFLMALGLGFGIGRCAQDDLTCSVG